jgi:hypothetical protein
VTFEGPVKIAGDVIHTLRDHPLAMVIVVINVLFIVSSAYTLWSISQAGERRDTLISQLAKDCVVIQK